MSAPRAVVFAYHDVGVRCLTTLLSGGVDVPLVVTVADDPRETQWYASVANTARDYGLKVITPEDANTSEVEKLVAASDPEFVFSFYYRSMLKTPLLNVARRGALNMHGSLLPKYRGRAPVNWAILRGERETGATLHYMVDRADAGDIVDQLAVPILQDDDAREVFNKVTVAAEIVLARSLPLLLTGRERRIAQTVEPNSYFGRRRPEDGRIDWSWPATRIHNLVRAVAPPFPGAFAMVDGQRWMIHRTRLQGEPIAASERARLFGADGRCYAACREGGVLEIISAATQAGPLDLPSIALGLQRQPLFLS
jgi:methionyl-tRNA formyltransferase